MVIRNKGGLSVPKYLGNVKEEIINTTRIMLEANGYDKLNIRDIAANSNIGIGTFYNYFKSKNEILSEVIRKEWEKTLKSIDNNLDNQGYTINKLMFIYSKINEFMKITHGSGLSEFSKDTDKLEFSRIKEMKKRLRDELNARVKSAISGKSEESKVNIYSDLITRLFISYASEGSEYIEVMKDFFELILKNN